MPETFSQYLKRWLSHATDRGLNNPLVKMPVKRFRKLQPFEFNGIAKDDWIRDGRACGEPERCLNEFGHARFY